MTITPLVAVVSLAIAETPVPGSYQQPPQAIADLITAPPTPSTSISPDHAWMMIMKRPSLAPISELALPELRLAGLRIDPRTGGRSRASYVNALVLQDLETRAQHAVAGLPKDARVSGVQWSPNGRHFVFMLTTTDRLEAWVGDVDTRQVRRLHGGALCPLLGSAMQWLPDSSGLICRFRAIEGAPPASATPTPEPIVQENRGRRSPARTYQDLLQNPQDEAVFEHYLMARVLRVPLQGTPQQLAPAGLITRASPSPDGAYILTETLHRPYSYLVPASRFPIKVAVWTADGQPIKTLVDRPLADNVPTGFGAVVTGPRRFGWRADQHAELYWVEAGDGGDPKAEAEVRDRVFTLKAPFENQPVELVALGLRYSRVRWGTDKVAMVSEWWWSDRRSRTWIVNPQTPGSAPTKLFEHSFEDRYADPGDPVMRTTARGTAVLRLAAGGHSIYLRGTGASPQGDRPFLDRLDLASHETTRLWRSAEPYYETVNTILDDDGPVVLTRRESRDEPPNFFRRNLRGGAPQAMTDFPHPAPQLKGVHKQQIRYARADGVKLTGTLYLPPGAKPEDGPFPTLMWAYPQEFKSSAAAGQVTDSPHRFVRVRATSPLLWLMHGYAVLDDPGLPIIGEGATEPNDTYVEQLVSGAQAAVDELVRRGISERHRIAIGGHSYGAFMTANLLAHSDLFAAGIARSGAYNRTLTPFGFQSEERTFWQAPEVYFRMSPFMHADRVNEPILLIHGEADNNSGTFPMQSRRYFNALRGHGAQARLVMLPHESHGYRARESLMHMAWEMTTWLDRYVKNATAKKEGAG
jgi:dipeptidyl aminopeptidase/acylaminoacyl peptidase